MLFKYIKFGLFLSISICFYFIGVFFGDTFGQEVTTFIIFPLAFLTLNYAFLKLIMYYIKYYNNLIIFYKQQIIVIKSSLLGTDNVEIVDLHKITKLDTFCNGIMPNLLGYGILVLEQQRDEVREFWYVPNPHKAISFLNEEREKIFGSGNNNQEKSETD